MVDPIAKQHTAIGAHEFAVYYIHALDWSSATSDPYLLRQVSGQSCTSCRTDIENLSRLAAEGGYLSSGRLKIDSVLTLPGKGDVKADYVIKFRLTQEPVVVIEPTATTTQVPSPKIFDSYVYVSWVSNRWVIPEREGTR